MAFVQDFSRISFHWIKEVCDCGLHLRKSTMIGKHNCMTISDSNDFPVVCVALHENKYNNQINVNNG